MLRNFQKSVKKIWHIPNGYKTGFPSLDKLFGSRLPKKAVVFINGPEHDNSNFIAQLGGKILEQDPYLVERTIDPFEGDCDAFIIYDNKRYTRVFDVDMDLKYNFKEKTKLTILGSFKASIFQKMCKFKHDYKLILTPSSILGSQFHLDLYSEGFIHIGRVLVKYNDEGNIEEIKF